MQRPVPRSGDGHRHSPRYAAGMRLRATTVRSRSHPCFAPRSRARTLVLTVPLALAAALCHHASAEPQAAGVLAPGGFDEASRSQGRGATPAPLGGESQPQSTAKTPKKPESPPDNTIFAPPLAGYVVMFLLGGAVVMLNLWSSKRTQLD